MRPAEISTPGLKLKKGAATQYLGGTMDSFPYVEVDQAHITKKRRR